jgi:hypothetical protein
VVARIVGKKIIEYRREGKGEREGPENAQEQIPLSSASSIQLEQDRLRIFWIFLVQASKKVCPCVSNKSRLM